MGDLGEGHLRHHAALEHTEHSSCGQEPGETLDESRAERDDSETDDEQGQVVLGTNFLQNDV